MGCLILGCLCCVFLLVVISTGCCDMTFIVLGVGAKYPRPFKNFMGFLIIFVGQPHTVEA